MASFLDPEEILNQLDLLPVAKAVEFGCGSGHFTIALGKRLKKGIVYGIDIRKDLLSALKSRASLENIDNIKLIFSDLEGKYGSTLPSLSLNLVLAPNIFFQLEKKKAIILEAKRILKRNGKLVVIDWRENSPYGPSDNRVSEEEILKMAKEIGFKEENDLKAGEYHYGFIFRKS